MPEDPSGSASSSETTHHLSGTWVEPEVGGVCALLTHAGLPWGVLPSPLDRPRLVFWRDLLPLNFESTEEKHECCLVCDIRISCGSQLCSQSQCYQDWASLPREDSHTTHESSVHTHIAWETLATVLKVPRGQLWGQAYFDVCLTS